MKMKIILIAIIASCYAAPGYEKSKNGLIPQAKNDYKLLPQLQAKNDYKRPPQVQKQTSPQATGASLEFQPNQGKNTKF